MIMKNRKTVEIDFVKEKINLALSNKEFPLNTDQKEILCATLETILHKVNGYRGFMFLDNSDTEILTNGYFSRKYF
jgi:hypothetical protein